MQKNISAIIQVMRINQWTKNLFVIAPLIFSLHFFEISSVVNTLIITLAFCLASSTVYIINDIMDRENDRKHPHKSNRPIANRTLSITQAIILAMLTLLSSIILAAILNINCLLVTIGYIVLNIAYSVKLKQLVIIDVLTIAIGFILRIFAGCFALGVNASHFILLTTFFIAIFIGFSKRKSEIQTSGNDSRMILQYYSAEMLNHFISISAGLTIICYSLYTIDPATIERFHTDKLLFSVIFVIYGVFRYLYLVNQPKAKDDPSETIVKDRAMLINVLLYVVFVVVLLSMT